VARWRAKVAFAFALLFAAAAPAQDRAAAGSLDALLQEVRQGRAEDRAANRAREQEFEARKQERARLLAEAEGETATLEQRSTALEQEFQRNERELEQLEEELAIRLGSLGELFGVVRQVAGDTRALVERSIVSAQIPGREEALDALARSRRLPSKDQLVDLWFALQQEATEAGKLTRFRAPVVAVDGTTTERDVLRIGPFTALTSDGEFLQYTDGALRQLQRSPGGVFTRSAERFANASGAAVAPIDPSKGSILALEIQRPTFAEQIGQGGLIGYVIIAIGAAGLLLALWRLLGLTRTAAAIARAEPGRDDPLSRILDVYEKNPDADTEALELRLDEAVMLEVPRLERGITMVRVLSVIAPLLGLLGTVTGMIRTFQMITLFGTGDPKLMAGGISVALVTTMLGLTVAIPLTFLASLLRERSKGLREILEGRAAGMVAERAEARHGAFA